MPGTVGGQGASSPRQGTEESESRGPSWWAGAALNRTFQEGAVRRPYSPAPVASRVEGEGMGTPSVEVPTLPAPGSPAGAYHCMNTCGASPTAQQRPGLQVLSLDLRWGPCSNNQGAKAAPPTPGRPIHVPRPAQLARGPVPG